MDGPYHVYMDLDVVDNDYSSTSKPRLRFEETGTTPLFLPGDSADYVCSIARFNIQTGNALPAFIPGIETGRRDVKPKTYNVSSEYTPILNLSSAGTQKANYLRGAQMSYTW